MNKLSKEANSRLKRAEMAATGAPLHSYFLNFVSLDRYRKLGITPVQPGGPQVSLQRRKLAEIVPDSLPRARQQRQKASRLLSAKINTNAVSK